MARAMVRTLAGKRVLLTGAAGGIGSALAHLLAGKGARLVLADRDEGGLTRLRHELVSAWPSAVIQIQPVEHTSRESLEALITFAGREPLDVLINNAGVAPGISFEHMQPSEVDAVLDINLRSLVHLTRCLLPGLLERGRAHIVNVASAAGLAAAAGMCAYATSKFGVVGFSEALRAELADRGVGVSCVCPAFVRTSIVANSRLAPSDDPEAEAKRLVKLDKHVQRAGVSPEKVARVVFQAIRRNRARVVIGGLARVLIGLRFFFPGLVDWINRVNYRRFKRLGMLR